jgi:hypothetical protein
MLLPSPGQAWGSCLLPLLSFLVVFRLIKEIDVSGVLLIPLWKGAKFWLSAFPDGCHASTMFKGIFVLSCKVAMWDMNPRNAFGSYVKMLVLPFVSGGGAVFCSLVAPANCIRRLFEFECTC